MTIPSMNKLSTVFPIMIDKYEQFIPNIEGMGVPDKINAIIQYLNRMGKLSNDVVADWNKVMTWVMDEGLTDTVNAKVDDMVAKGTFDELLNGMMSDLNTANTTFQNSINTQETNFQNTINGQVNTLTTSLAESATNVKSKGIIINDDTKASQNTTILKDLFLNSVDPIYLPQGTIAFNDTLVLGVGVKVFANPKTILKLTNPNINGVVVNDKTVVEDLTISVPVGFSMTAILLDGTKRINTCTGRNVRIEGVSGYTGTAIRASAMNNGDYVAFVDYSNIYIKNVNNGIIVEDIQASGTGWANGNRFNKVSIIANNGISIKGGASGNEFNFQYQTVSSTVNAIYCEGGENKFTGFVWDINQYGSAGKIAVFTEASKDNIIALPPINVNFTYITDDGTDNLFVYDNRDFATFKPLNTKANYTVFPDKFNINVPVFHGIQDNCLAYIDKTATVNVTGNIVYNPGTSYLFNSKKIDTLILGDPSLTPATIELDTSANPIDSMYLLGITFWNGAGASDYKIDIVTTSGGSYTNLITVTGNRKSSIVHMLSRYGMQIYKIKITITKAIYNTTVNTSKQIWVSNIFGANNGTYFNSPYLFKDGGKLYGDLDLNKNKAKNLVLDSGATASRPTSPVIGQVFYDTTLGKPIYCKVGGASPTWTDATGTTV